MGDDPVVVVPPLGRFAKAGWGIPSPAECLLGISVIAAALMVWVFPIMTLAWKVCGAIGYIAGVAGIPTGIKQKSPREQMILAEHDIAAADAQGKPAPVKALAIVAAATGTTPLPAPLPTPPEEPKP